MHPKERLLGMAKLLKLRGEPIPLDMLVEAERLGLSHRLLDEPTNDNANLQEGDILNGKEQTI